MTQVDNAEEAAAMDTPYNDVQLKIFRDRYARGDEQYPHEAWDRVARAVAEHESDEATQEEWKGKFRSLLDGFRYLPGGRITAAMGTDAGVTAQNCYVIPSPHDSRQGIMKALNEWVEIQSRGGGVGVNMSSLRPRGNSVQGVNGTSSGPVNWAQPFAFISKNVIIQGGSRRGAAMIMLDDDHPDVIEFIHAKEASGVLEGCNVSVCISDAFMEAVKQDGDWDLKFNGEVHQTIKARQLWDEICEAAWKSAEPGVYFMERANREANSGYFETLISTNPCGEQPLGPYGACLLGAFNLDSFMHQDADGRWAFDFEEFREYIPYAVRFNDNVVDLSHYPIEECRNSQQRIRRMGIGVMGLADCLLRMEIRYGSDESERFTEEIFQTLRDTAYRASAKLAKERGPFPAYTPEFLERPFVQRLPARRAAVHPGERHPQLLPADAGAHGHDVAGRGREQRHRAVLRLRLHAQGPHGRLQRDLAVGGAVLVAGPAGVAGVLDGYPARGPCEGAGSGAALQRLVHLEDGERAQRAHGGRREAAVHAGLRLRAEVRFLLPGRVAAGAGALPQGVGGQPAGPGAGGRRIGGARGGGAAGTLRARGAPAASGRAAVADAQVPRGRAGRLHDRRHVRGRHARRDLREREQAGVDGERPDGHGGDADELCAAVRRADHGAGDQDEELALRAERPDGEPADPDRVEHRGLRVPVAGAEVCAGGRGLAAVAAAGGAVRALDRGGCAARGAPQHGNERRLAACRHRATLPLYAEGWARLVPQLRLQQVRVRNYYDDSVASRTRFRSSENVEQHP
ncbi:MAG: adenosylcobalamin-dependent ribonucleoside-diphosphate reductase [Dehalococcoidia bacterium]|nr:adenosylcobalamin-dependent ribonucleoside-diphosphate reductase [Dehalococcoidia bacterium]